MTEIEIAPYLAGPATLVTARSYLIDRVVPGCEIVALPAKEVAGGRVSWRREKLVLPAVRPSAPAKRLQRRLLGAAPARRIEGRVLFDMRRNSPQNWAHFLNNHLPLFFRLAEAAGVGLDEALLIVPKDMPGYMYRAAALFGIELLATDGAVEGEGVSFSAEPWPCVRAERYRWVRAPHVTAALAKSTAGGAPLPARVFLSRRKTRAIENAGEVEAFLAARGFVAVYPEDLAPADQFRLFREAETMVAIHGAGLGPLLYRPEGGLRRLVEILPCGHMSDAFRVMAHQGGCAWIGVRGRIKPDYVAPAYRLDEAFSRFSLDGFEVDVAALERAFDILDEETRHG